jgi:hypothetical protein
MVTWLSSKPHQGYLRSQFLSSDLVAPIKRTTQAVGKPPLKAVTKAQQVEKAILIS